MRRLYSGVCYRIWIKCQCDGSESRVHTDDVIFTHMYEAKVRGATVIHVCLCVHTCVKPKSYLLFPLSVFLYSICPFCCESLD